ncbi:class I SAM-dependent methyltransferase [Methanocella sp. MCL-LM]|uniref:class I SAM-dependent methyltransferase n=1 Tax=Methanocella sp. MCL-LM TaxID=3412035 RepID=UPI003C75A206
MTNNEYVHGYSDRENFRLHDQACTLEELLHHDTVYPAGSRILEAGCGVGAQTVILAAKSPGARITSVDLSPVSIEQAKSLAASKGITNVEFITADIFDLPFPENSFDHIFLCFVLEHLDKPDEALSALKRMLKSGGTLTAIEGDHGSAYFHPASEAANKAIQCLVNLQRQAGGDSLIGRRLYPVLRSAGFGQVSVSPRMVYVDFSRPQLVEGFTKKTFTAMVEGVGEQAISEGMIDRASWEKGIADLYRTAEADGVFCYTFFKAVARK